MIRIRLKGLAQKECQFLCVGINDLVFTTQYVTGYKRQNLKSLSRRAVKSSKMEDILYSSMKAIPSILQNQVYNRDVKTVIVVTIKKWELKKQMKEPQRDGKGRILPF